MFRLKRSILILFLLFLAGTGLNCSSALTGLNGSPEIFGVAFDNNDQGFQGATIFLPGKAVSSLELEDAKSLEVDCGAQGGILTCDDPPVSFCAQTCSCADGSYVIDTTFCADDSLTITVCFAGICRDSVLDCPPNAPCEVDISVPLIN